MIKKIKEMRTYCSHSKCTHNIKTWEFKIVINSKCVANFQNFNNLLTSVNEV